MSLQVICVEDVEPQRWRNGGGHTRELLAWPSTDLWEVRISVADIEADGPFSVFEGVERWMAVISGAGIALNFGDVERRLTPGDEPLRFDGGAAPNCRLLGGPTRDLNLMLRRGEGALRPVRTGAAWAEDFEMRGLFTTMTGRWTGNGESRSVPAMTLLWIDAATAPSTWTFETDKHRHETVAWWLGFTPGETQTPRNRVR